MNNMTLSITRPILPANPDAMASRPEADHVLGEVADDWDAAEIWLSSVRPKNNNGAQETENTYRHHLNKLRWYCEHVGRVTPSRWSIRDAKLFIAFLNELPGDAISRKGLAADEPDWTPFKCQPSISSQSDIRRCLSAMFAHWHAAGYIRINPMALVDVRAVRKAEAGRSMHLDVFEQVMAVMEQADKKTFMERQAYMRDRFILEALRGMGLKANELVGAQMSAFMHVNPQSADSGHRIFVVSKMTGEGGIHRPIPVPPAVWDAFTAYRAAFGLPSHPEPGEKTRLILSPRTKAVIIAGEEVMHAGSRRFFGAWREVTTRQGLHGIVKDRFRQAAQALESKGDADGAAQLHGASTHWLRSLAKAAPTAVRKPSDAVMHGHTEIPTVMRYSQQDAHDLIATWERAHVMKCG